MSDTVLVYVLAPAKAVIESHMTWDEEWVRVARWDNIQQTDWHQENLPDRTILRLQAHQSWEWVEGALLSLGLCGQLLRDSCALAQQLEGWDRWAGTAGTRRQPQIAPVLLVGEALVPGGWEDSVGLELWLMQNPWISTLALAGQLYERGNTGFLWWRYIQRVQTPVCLHLGWVYKNKWMFPQRAFQIFLERVFFYYCFQTQTQHICHFLVFCFLLWSQRKTQKRMASNHFCLSRSHTQLPCICSLPELEGLLIL